MNITLITTNEDRLGGVFAEAYRAANGPLLKSLVTLNHATVPDPLSKKVAMAVKLLGVKGALQLTSSKFGWLKSNGPTAGLSQQWPAAIAGSETILLRDRNVKNEKFICELEQSKPDVIVSVGAPIIFGKRLLEIPRITAINVHNGLLPKYRGHFGTFWEVAHKETHAYVCINEMVSKVDSGEILGWDRIAISEAESFFDLLVQKKRLGGQLLASVLLEIQYSGKIPSASPFDHAGAIPDLYHPFPSSKDIWQLKWNSKHGLRVA